MVAGTLESHAEDLADLVRGFVDEHVLCAVQPPFALVQACTHGHGNPPCCANSTFNRMQLMGAAGRSIAACFDGCLACPSLFIPRDEPTAANAAAASLAARPMLHCSCGLLMCTACVYCSSHVYCPCVLQVQHVFIDSNRPAPVILSHSFGGLILQKWVQVCWTCETTSLLLSAASPHSSLLLLF